MDSTPPTGAPSGAGTARPDDGPDEQPTESRRPDVWEDPFAPEASVPGATEPGGDAGSDVLDASYTVLGSGADAASDAASDPRSATAPGPAHEDPFAVHHEGDVAGAPSTDPAAGGTSQGSDQAAAGGGLDTDVAAVDTDVAAVPRTVQEESPFEARPRGASDGVVRSTGRARIGVPAETAEHEGRVALVPDAVKKLTGAGHKVYVQRGAGAPSFIDDQAYEKAGATVVTDAASVYAAADLIVKVQKPNDEELGMLRPGTGLVAFLQPMTNLDLVRTLAERGVTAFSMDAVPRTTRAQYMDALSSMATVAGYKAVLMAADRLPKFMPQLTTAAGSIKPAQVLVIGAGVAGLQAIATARRLGAVVYAYDTRPVVKEQVESLGARFVDIDTGEQDTQDAGGYAKQASEETLRKQAEALANRAVRCDAVISTAAVPGRAAPRLIFTETVEQMAPGSVIVDLAAETGGNCELTQPGEIVEHHGVTIIGTLNLPSRIPVHASQMYSKNIQNLLEILLDESGALHVNPEDEIVAGSVITRDGEVVHEGTRARLEPAGAAA